MSKAELLSILTPKGVTVDAIHGGRASITQMDVAAMMARCSPSEDALLRAIHTQDAGQYHRALAYWFTLLKAQGWTKKVEQVEVVAKVTFEEYVLNPRCRSCNGTRGLMKGSKWEECEKCKGMGYRSLSGMEIARKLGLSRLQSPWDARVAWARRRIRIWECDAIEKLA